MTERFKKLKKLVITTTIFDDIAADTPDNFKEKIRQHYIYLFFEGGYRPVIQDKRLDDAWGAFCHDKKHAKDIVYIPVTKRANQTILNYLAY